MKERMTEDLLKKIMIEIDNPSESFARIIYEISQDIDNTDYKYCYKLWDFTDMYQEFFGTEYNHANEIYKIQESMSDQEFPEYLKEHLPRMYEYYGF